jgi:hypothetical protein
VADRSVEVDVLASDKTASGLDSAANRFKKFGDDVDRKSKETGEKAGRGLGSGIGSGLSKLGQGVTSGLAKLGTVAGGKLGDAISGALSSASPQVQAAIGGVVAGAVATLAPLLGGALSAAVIGGAAGAGIVGGIALAARDSRIQGAASALGQRIMSSLNASGGVFLQPVLASIQQISERFARLGPLIGRGLAAAATFVEPLTSALLDAGEAITLGLVAAIQNAGPVMASIGNGIRSVGQAIGGVFALLSTQSDAAASALDAVFAIISGAIQIVGQFVYILTAAWGAITTLGGLLGDDSANIKKVGPDSRDATAGLLGLIPALDTTGTSAGGAASAMTALGAATNNLASANATLDQSQITLNASLAAAKQVREQGTVVTDNERNALLNLNTEIQNHLEKMTAQGASSDAVNAKSNTLRASFIQQAIQMGATAAEAEQLANRYGLIPKVVDTDVVLTGAARAKQELEWVQAAAGSIPAAINIAVRVTGSSNVGEVARSLAKQSMMADRVNAYEHAASRFAGGGFGGMSPLAGASVRQGNNQVSLINRIRVELDGRQLAPEMARTASAVYDTADWKKSVGPR